MKKRCIYCEEPLDQNSEVCPHCGLSNGDLPENIDGNLKHKINQTCHISINKETSKINSALCFAVVGAILTIIGLIFLFLSFRYNVIKQKVFIPGSTEFVCCVICLVIGLTGLIYGIVRLILAIRKRRQIKKLIRLR